MGLAALQLEGCGSGRKRLFVRNPAARGGRGATRFTRSAQARAAAGTPTDVERAGPTGEKKLSTEKLQLLPKETRGK